MKRETITPSFVEFIPRVLEEGTLYISQKYGTAAHKCCCGCGVKIVTPLTPTDWSITVSHGTVTLCPSIGNWNHPCQSHYFIRQNCVVWDGKMSKEEIDRGRAMDFKKKEAYFSAKRSASETPTVATGTAPKTRTLWTRVIKWLRSILS